MESQDKYQGDLQWRLSMTDVFFFILLVIVSYLLARVEIEIEGKYGYAKKLPVSWRTENKWLRYFFTGTSYHLYMGLFLLALVHLPFVCGASWSWGREMLVLSFLAFLTVAEDFLWFVFNPHFGIRKFKRASIPWFKQYWLGFLPFWYWYYIPIGVLLYVGSKFVD